MPRVITLQEAEDIVGEYEGRQVSVASLEELGNAGIRYGPTIVTAITAECSG